METPTVEELTPQEYLLKAEFRQLLFKFNDALLEKLMANERKYKFGHAWKIPDWEEKLQRDLIEHVAKGDPRDVAIFGLFAWYHSWKTGPAPETDEELAARTVRNMNLISDFIGYVKLEADIDIPEPVFESFFDA